MIEMLGVLAIIGVLSVGGIMGYSKAMFRYKINKTIEQVTYIAGNIRALYASQGNYDGLGNSLALKKARIFPEDMPWKDNIGPLNVYDGYVTPATARRGDTTDAKPKAFEIPYMGIPLEACIELATHDWKDAGVKLVMTRGIYFVPPISPDVAARVCDSSQYGGYLEFYFDIDVNSNYWQQKISSSQSNLQYYQ